MSLQEIIKTMFRSFGIIVTGITGSTGIFCAIFFPDAIFGVEIFGQIFLLGLLCLLPYFVFYSRRELGKYQMLVRMILHLILILAILLSFAVWWEWIAITNGMQTTVFVLLVLIVYSAVFAITHFRAKRLAAEMNDGLQRYQRDLE